MSGLPTEVAERIGKILRGKWRLDALIDVGGMAAVYSATHCRNGSKAAIKVLYRERSCIPDVARRFLREGYIANAVEHPGVVRVLDDDVDEDGSVFVVMELLEGSTLHDGAHASGGHLGIDETLAAIDQVLDVLAYAHDRGIVHRDIKPENLFATLDGYIKVLDFGIAQPPTHAVDNRTTLDSGPLGTPAFMPPEQARGRFDLVGPASDLWAVGATLFTLLTGRIVHGEGTPAELLATACTRPAPSLRTVMPEAPALLVDLVDRALAVRIADRWPDAETMQRAVRTVRAAIQLGVDYSLPVPARTPLSTTARSRARAHIPSQVRDVALAIAAAVVSFAGVTALASALTSR